ncbi:WG repeat-containing protein [Butyrivibrio proteoclasticus]|uniref:WG repeat-containing protein n=1 Tax=Butyrivibrio proteoclasticus TaxID=43305 RepID=UPI0004793D86|nr:WG repeat-containing protein [Butyrivibrio proteoclasticus]
MLDGLNNQKNDNKKLYKIIRLTLTVILIAVVIISILLSRLDYSDVTTANEDWWKCPDGYEEYRVHNYWPKWSPFYEERVGLINHNNETLTKAIYKDWLVFGDDGLAWDYEGHLIDEMGDVAVDCSFVLNEYYSGSPRRLAINTFLALDDYSMHQINDRASFGRTYTDNYIETMNNPVIGEFADNGLARFKVMKVFSDGIVNITAGFVDRDGNVAIEPVFDSVKDFDGNGYAIVFDHGNYGIINEKGDYVVDPDYLDISTIVIDGELCYRLDNGIKYLNSKLEVIGE